MLTSQSIKRGVQSRKISRSRPKNNWEFFSPMASIPKGMERIIPLPTEAIRSNHMEPEMERLVQGGKKVEVLPPQ
jgi:hypothetical protein